MPHQSSEDNTSWGSATVASFCLKRSGPYYHMNLLKRPFKLGHFSLPLSLLQTNIDSHLIISYKVILKFLSLEFKGKNMSSLCASESGLLSTPFSTLVSCYCPLLCLRTLLPSSSLLMKISTTSGPYSHMTCYMTPLLVTLATSHVNCNTIYCQKHLLAYILPYRVDTFVSSIVLASKHTNVSYKDMLNETWINYYSPGLVPSSLLFSFLLSFSLCLWYNSDDCHLLVFNYNS